VLLLALPAAGPVDHGDRDGVHQVVDLLLDAVHGVGGHEEVPLVQVLNDKLGAKLERLVHVEEELLHGRVALDEHALGHVNHDEGERRGREGGEGFTCG